MPKHAAQARVYKDIWADIKKRMGRYKTVPTIVKGAVTRLRPDVVYALKIGQAISQDAFTALSDAEAVATAIANRYDLPVGIIDKRTRAVAKTVGSRKKTAASYRPNPSHGFASPGEYWFADGLGIVASRSYETIKKKAMAKAKASGKRVVVNFEDGSREGKQPVKVKPRKPVGAKPGRRNAMLSNPSMWVLDFKYVTGKRLQLDYDTKSAADNAAKLVLQQGGTVFAVRKKNA